MKIFSNKQALELYLKQKINTLEPTYAISQEGYVLSNLRKQN